MYTPDRVFLKDLKQLDCRLGCYYNTDHNHFVITHARAVGKPSELLLVETDSGSFRQPDNREIMTLCEGDLHRTDMETRLQKSAKYMEDHRKKQDADIRSDIRDATKDDRLQLKSTYAKVFNDGKSNSAFRRI